MEEKREKDGDSSAKGLKIGAAVLGAFLLLAAAGGVYFYSFDRPSGSGRVHLRVEKAATGRDIAGLLEKKGVIRSASLFNVYARLTGEGNQLQSGDYHLNRGLTVKEAIAAMKSGRVEAASVTVPEGYTVRQIAGLLREAGIAGAEDFEREASSYGPLPYQYGPVAAPVKGEGFLFADTYSIPLDYTARQVCDLMYQHTDEMLTEAMRRQAAAKNLPLHSLFTLASMVEREARFKEDQVPIASVMLLRLSMGMPLQIDATIQYALGAQKAELSLADTRIDSPYNTYTHVGLPPGPIGSPGLDALQAVLAAEPGEYLYYVAEADGHHVFTRTYAEHQAETERIYGSSS